jgi:NAD(P)-dependent dehydrogenase (short-subunit alcohol dehydrogenase family)
MAGRPQASDLWEELSVVEGRGRSGLLASKVAVVTGGASGIGAAICKDFAAQGAALVIADVDADKAREVAKQLGADAIAVTADVTQFDQAQAAAAAAVDRFGSIDILVNCAGWNQFRSVEDYTLDYWQKIRAINLDGPWNFCTAVMPTMIRQKAGKIVNISSAAGYLGVPNAAPYSTSKLGVIGLTRALAVDLGPHNINVNCICPAAIETPLLREATNAHFVTGITERMPLARLGQPTDISRAVSFLAGPDSDWITGVVLPVDGGLTCCLRAHHYE